MNIISIVEHDSINSLTGFTTTLYFAGCSHQCEGCFSPQTWNYHQGRSYTVEEIMEVILMSRNKNVTLLGGDPFYFKNREESIELIKSIKERTDKNVYVWSGYLIEEIHNWIDVKLIDYLIDGRFILEEKDIRLILRGSKNQRVFKNGKNITDKVEEML